MAKRFQFRLQQVLNLRKQQEDLKVRELAETKGTLLQHEELMKAHQKEEEGFLEEYGTLQKEGRFNVEDAVLREEHWSFLLKRNKNDQKKNADLLQQVEEKRQSTVQVSRKRRLLENLRERQWGTHQNEVAQEEQKFLDEISSIAFVRRDRAEKAAPAETAQNLGR